MLSLKLPSHLRVLCLGAHCDDIEIGCGGTIMRLTDEHTIDVKWMVFTSSPARSEEAHRSAEKFLCKANQKEIIVKSMKDGHLPYQAPEVKELIEELKKYQPDIIFTHSRFDLHQDHRLLNELTWNTFRNHMIMEYEIPKYDGDLGNPDLFVPLTEDIAGKKIDALLDCFASQSAKHWFDRETFISMLRLRGLQCATRYAEAFYVRKVVLN